MRHIILDTETTGRAPELGHRIIEIGAIVIQNREMTPESFHRYLNPGRESDPEALAVHGLSQSFLADKPTFDAILDDLLHFLVKNGQKSELIIHNAKFDTAFLNAEINLCNQANQHAQKNPSPYRRIEHYCDIKDSLKLARELHPNQRNSLDALCKRYQVDNTKRQVHGALLDAELLAQVYLKMTAGQPSLFGKNTILGTSSQRAAVDHSSNLSALDLPVQHPTPEEEAAHKQQLTAISQQAGVCIWKNELFDNNST